MNSAGRTRKVRERGFCFELAGLGWAAWAGVCLWGGVYGAALSKLADLSDCLEHDAAGEAAGSYWKYGYFIRSFCFCGILIWGRLYSSSRHLHRYLLFYSILEVVLR
jgi:hypothetical protein